MKNQRFWREFESEVKSREWATESGRSNAFRYHTGVRYIGIDRQNLVSRYGRRKPHKSRKLETVFESDEE